MNTLEAVYMILERKERLDNQSLNLKASAFPDEVSYDKEKYAILFAKVELGFIAKNIYLHDESHTYEEWQEVYRTVCG